ncbi:TPA: hypothetical protein ACXI9S_003076 [Pseudomonas aeruginosa]|nr:hypothetical protein [Pseudomonas aeruginosa]ELL0590446.1 hypothetical protein [Pseudomonas aeruginosa]MBH9454611.1 hypothetical protein [Pseudomonas aeruginosa]HEJ3548739.1 hypothetical protein [Pseudomonas aeruginosa]HEN8205311.1 hypothetical protein [Pseudomonas aeruginosa]
MNKANECTCPSGDGSLVHPCPAHPAVDQAGGDRWDALQSIMEWTAAENIPDDRKLCLIRNAARAALAQPSQSQYEASFEEWLANELEGEDGHPVPAAVCDIALARRAFNHWPKLEQPAKVGGVRFSAGVSSRLVVEAAQRLYEFESTPEKEAERIEQLQAFREQLDPLNLAPHAEAFNEAPDEALRPEQAEAERSALWAVHAQGPDELYAAFSREDAEKHAAELNALPMPEGIAVGAVVVPSPWPAVQHWQYLAEQEQDHKNEIAGRLRQHERIGEALRAEIAEWQEAAGRSRSDVVAYIAERAKLLEERDTALTKVAELERQEPVALANRGLHAFWVKWTEAAAGLYGPGIKLYAAPVVQAQQLHDLDKQCRDDVARALGLRPNQERGFAWSYLLASIKSCVKASEDSAQAQHSVPGDIMRDAQRYRWLRDQQFYFSFSTENSDAGISSCTAGMSSRFKNLSWVDAAIDSAIAAAPGKEGV